MLLLPEGEVVPPYARPAAEARAFVALQGSVGVRTLTCMDPGSGAVLAAGLPENGLHDPRSLAAQTNKNGCITPGGPGSTNGQGFAEADCVCRGGVCPRREGCKFWVELMRERLQRKKACSATCADFELDPASPPLVLTFQNTPRVPKKSISSDFTW